MMCNKVKHTGHMPFSSAKRSCVRTTYNKRSQRFVCPFTGRETYMLVKICGTSTKKSAHTAIQNGADLIGFVFATSTCHGAAEEAATTTAPLPPFIKKVGVFVNETKDRIEHIAEKTRLDFIQLHGDESPAFANSLSLPVIKAFPATKEALV